MDEIALAITLFSLFIAAVCFVYAYCQGILCIFVTRSYKADPTAPSVITSHLPEGLWYGSVVRYTEKYGKGKIVVVSVKTKSLVFLAPYLLKAWVFRVDGTKSGRFQSAKPNLTRMVEEANDGDYADYKDSYGSGD